MTDHPTRPVILAYWKSWQDEDWDGMRASLADTVNFGGHSLEREQFVHMCQNGNAWKNVELIDSMFTDEGGALLYEGTDSTTDRRIRIAEIVRVDGGRVCGANACFGSGTPS